MFYAACIAKGKENLLQGATAGRLAQADSKGWKDFTKELQQSIRSLVLPESDAKKPAKTDVRMAGFFQQLKSAKGRNQLK